MATTSKCETAPVALLCASSMDSQPFATELEFEDHVNFVTEGLMDKIASVHPDALVAWDRDVAPRVRNTGYLSFHPAFMDRCIPGNNAIVFIGIVADRESWFEWEHDSEWCLHQAEETRTQIRDREELEW